MSEPVIGSVALGVCVGSNRKPIDPMTARRYESYSRAMSLIGEVSGQHAVPEATAVLRECAEDLLLSRNESSSTEELREKATDAVRHMAAAGAVSRQLATAICHAVYGSGPPAGEPVERANDALSPEPA